MRFLLPGPPLLLLLIPFAADGQTFSGNYALQTDEGSVQMSLQQDAAGKVEGTFTMEDGTPVSLDGQRKGAEVHGIARMGEKNILFTLRPQGAQMIFTMIPVTADNKPDMANATEFTFTKQGQGAGAGPAQSAPAGYSEATDEEADGPSAHSLAPGAGAGGNPLAGGMDAPTSDPWASTFSNEKLTLQLQGGSSQYQGQIRFQDQSFPVTGQSTDGRTLHGKFTSGGNTFDLSATLDGATVTLSTGGTTYRLRRQGATRPAAAPAIPLGGATTHAVAARRASPISGNEVTDPSLGVRFTVPQGWRHEKRQALYVMGHTTIPGMVLIMPHEYNSIQDALAKADEPLYQADDGQLVVEGSPQPLANNLVAVDYGGMIQGKPAKGRLACIISPHGGGFLVLAGADAGSYGPQYAQLAEGIARSMRFSKPQAPPEAAMWKQKLAGQRLAYMKSGGSSDIGGAYAWSDQRDIYICSDSSFQAQGGFSGSIGTANASGWTQDGSGPQSGQWAIIGQAGQPALQLRHGTGDSETFVLTTDGSKTFLNGVRYFVVENTMCQ